MHKPFGFHSGIDTGLSHQVDQAPLKHAGPDAPQHVLTRLALQHDRVDPGAMQQLAQQKA